MLTRLCNLHPLIPHLFIVKLGFTRENIFFLPAFYVLGKNKKNIKNFHLKITLFTVMKNYGILVSVSLTKADDLQVVLGSSGKISCTPYNYMVVRQQQLTQIEQQQFKKIR